MPQKKVNSDKSLIKQLPQKRTIKKRAGGIIQFLGLLNPHTQKNWQHIHKPTKYG